MKNYFGHHLKFKRSRETKSGDIITGEWMVKGSEKNHLQFIHEILNNQRLSNLNIEKKSIVYC